jgi:hypothetical protein
MHYSVARGQDVPVTLMMISKTHWQKKKAAS